MYLKKTVSLASAIIISLCMIERTEASLDLLAGVEAGIDTNTAMESSDLEQTQKILASRTEGTRHVWVNENTGTRYEILIDHQFSYGHYPCLAYDLTIDINGKQEKKALNACEDSSGQWISITAGSSAL